MEGSSHSEAEITEMKLSWWGVWRRQTLIWPPQERRVCFSEHPSSITLCKQGSPLGLEMVEEFLISFHTRELFTLVNAFSITEKNLLILELQQSKFWNSDNTQHLDSAFPYKEQISQNLFHPNTISGGMDPSQTDEHIQSSERVHNFVSHPDLLIFPLLNHTWLKGNTKAESKII